MNIEQPATTGPAKGSLERNPANKNETNAQLRTLTKEIRALSAQVTTNSKDFSRLSQIFLDFANQNKDLTKRTVAMARQKQYLEFETQLKEVESRHENLLKDKQIDLEIQDDEIDELEHNEHNRVIVKTTLQVLTAVAVASASYAFRAKLMSAAVAVLTFAAQFPAIATVSASTPPMTVVVGLACIGSFLTYAIAKQLLHLFVGIAKAIAYVAKGGWNHKGKIAVLLALVAAAGAAYSYGLVAIAIQSLPNNLQAYLPKNI